MIIEIRWHGRGGQGAVTASELTARAAIREGKVALAFPQFGAERRGAPVVAFTRVSDEKIILPRTPITNPDIIVVMDPTLLPQKFIYSGVKQGGLVIANTVRSPEEVKRMSGRDDLKIATVNATKIAMEIFKRPIVNTPVLGSLAKVAEELGLPLFKLESLLAVIPERFSGKVAELNIEAVKKAYEEVKLG